MNSFHITIDGKRVEVAPGSTLLEAARQIGLDIPTLCHLEKCGPLTSCQVCLVKVSSGGQGRLVPSCATKAEPDMVIESETAEVHEARRTAIELLFSDHVGDCISPCNRLCPLELDIPMMIRRIAANRLDEAIAIVRHALPLAGVLGRLCHHPCEQGCRRGVLDEPAAIRDMERFLAEHDLNRKPGPGGAPPSELPAAGQKSVVIVGAGPAGLAAAHDLARHRHAVTVMDRHDRPGGGLRNVPESELPRAVLDAEIALLENMGIHFKMGVELGTNVTLDDLRRGSNAVLLAVGELAGDDGPKTGAPLAGAWLEADPSTCRAGPPGVFAAGACVRRVRQLVRAMAEGRAAARCVHQFLLGQTPLRREESAFSSVMGRLKPGELEEFLRGASRERGVRQCASCSGLDHGDAAREAARCLHCDCRSLDHCLLRRYAQLYGANASRFRSERRPFQRQIQPGGVIFEPGKCILCGICVKLAELADKPPGLAFIGRGFDTRVAAPFGRPIHEGLLTVEEECVRHCPTGALAFDAKIIRP